MNGALILALIGVASALGGALVGAYASARFLTRAERERTRQEAKDQLNAELRAVIAEMTFVTDVLDEASRGAVVTAQLPTDRFAAAARLLARGLSGKLYVQVYNAYQRIPLAQADLDYNAKNGASQLFTPDTVVGKAHLRLLLALAELSLFANQHGADVNPIPVGSVSIASGGE